MKKRFFEQDGKLVYHKQSDPTAVVESAKARQRDGVLGFGENWHVGRIPFHLLEKWVKEAGLQLSDREAVRELLKRKLLDSDYKDLRVHEGTW